MRKIKKILLIDDDKVNNYLNTTLLKEMNIAHTISVEINGKRAIEHLLSHCRVGEKHDLCPELIILDYTLPVMDGLQMMKYLHKISFIQTHDIVFILLGIDLPMTIIKQFLDLGVQEYTDKPLSQETVIDAYYKYFSGDTAKQHTL